ncbi:hypothetical protein R1flu_002007 [Riccia fluitans]|uniref:Uncharacterized protein n=1 Tax=Riccia fluitans TaxID=41844 RepID=A0ABD1Y7V1_9MARC
MAEERERREQRVERLLQDLFWNGEEEETVNEEDLVGRASLIVEESDGETESNMWSSGNGSERESEQRAEMRIRENGKDLAEERDGSEEGRSENGLRS